MFDYTADIGGIGDRSEFTVDIDLSYLVFTYLLYFKVCNTVLIFLVKQFPVV